MAILMALQTYELTDVGALVWTRGTSLPTKHMLGCNRIDFLGVVCIMFMKGCFIRFDVFL